MSVEAEAQERFEESVEALELKDVEVLVSNLTTRTSSFPSNIPVEA